ncbi:MAG: OmpA family protein [Cytophagales bacterium]|nr:OmpA family protein [Cytophagales bacterium]
MGLVVGCNHAVFAQKQGDINKKLDKADKYFRVRNYENALPIYLEVAKSKEIDVPLSYKIGICYYEAEQLSDQVKSIQYLQKVVAKDKKNYPKDLSHKLARMYHKNNQLPKAIATLESYIKSVDTYNKKLHKELKNELKIYNNAFMALTSQKEVKISTMDSGINSEYTEYNPVVSTDQTVMAYTVLKPNNDKLTSSQKYVEEIYVSYRNIGGKWSAPQMIPINSKFNVGTAGISPDGENMLIFVGSANNTGSIYRIKRESTNEWSQPSPLDRGINSDYLESTASISPDGKTMYFASNRPGGYGGMDLYKAKKNRDGKWDTPQNLGPVINSKYDEDAPYIHPDGKTLFFTSNGLNSIGGNDIFKTVYVGKKWQEPKNMGYPINTTADDNYFTLTADGSVGYFSSNRLGGKGGQDIYYIDMPESERNIPLTLIKGRILDGQSLKPIATRIKVVNKKTQEKIDYVYNPNPKTGNYLIIFPPGENYDMIIESEGYLPYTININVPNQDNFYELYQKIFLKPIKQFGVIVGQEVEVKNAFFDTGQGDPIEPRKINDAMLVNNDSLDLYDIMDGIIASSDTTAFEYLLDLMYTMNPIDAVDFDDDNEKIESASRIYYYDETDESKLEAKHLDGKTVYSLPTMYVTELAEAQKNSTKSSLPKVNEKVLSLKSVVYFDVDKSDLKDNYHNELEKILATLEQYEQLGIEISGYASSDGNEQYNRELSDKRAISVLDYFNKKGVVRRRIVAKGYGASGDHKLSNEEARRVEVRLVDLNNL